MGIRGAMRPIRSLFIYEGYLDKKAEYKDTFHMSKVHYILLIAKNCIIPVLAGSG